MKWFLAFVFPFAGALGPAVMMPELPVWRALIVAACAGLAGVSAKGTNRRFRK